jgi:hypothetical protein
MPGSRALGESAVVNTTEKGTRLQRWAASWLEKAGWKVHNATSTRHRIGRKWVCQSNDIFGCDIIARRGVQVLWIQVSAWTHVEERLTEFTKYFTHLAPHERLQIWLKVPGRGGDIRILEVQPRAGTCAMAYEQVGRIEVRKSIGTFVSASEGYTGF